MRSFLLLEDGGYILQEDGTGRILLEFTEVEVDVEGPGSLPSIVLGGNTFLIRAGSLRHDPKTRVWADKVSLTHKRRRLLGNKRRSWAFTIALRSWNERLAFEGLAYETQANPSFYNFYDGLGNTYSVSIDTVGDMTPVVDNKDFWDVGVQVHEEWT